MGSDRARVSYDPKQQYRSVVMQQGRVTLEADWNEAGQIASEELRQETLDFVGPYGTPDDGYKILLANPSNPPYNFAIQGGTMYVGGVRAHLFDQVQYSNQPEWQDYGPEDPQNPIDPNWVDLSSLPGSPPITNEFVYLYLREQEVSAVEDPDLKDIALGGPDTAQRARLLQRFVRVECQGTNCATGLAAAEAQWQTEGLYLDSHNMRLKSWGNLQVSFSNQAQNQNPCQPQAQGGYLDPDNQLIRVQIAGFDPITGNPILVWGFDDASFLYRISVDPNNQQNLVFQNVPVDANHQPVQNQAVEVLRTAADLPNGGNVAATTGFVFTLDSNYTPETQSIAIPGGTSLPAEYTQSNQSPPSQLFLRVWQNEIITPPGTAMALGSTGVQVTLTLQSPGNPFHIGDYWLFAVRPATPQTVYPERYQEGPQPPDGPRVWACPLGVIDWNGTIGTVVSDCRPTFGPLASRALHITAINWPNDDLVSLPAFRDDPLQVSFDFAPAAPSVSDSTMIVTIEIPYIPEQYIKAAASTTLPARATKVAKSSNRAVPANREVSVGSKISGIGTIPIQKFPILFNAPSLPDNLLSNYVPLLNAAASSSAASAQQGMLGYMALAQPGKPSVASGTVSWHVQLPPNELVQYLSYLSLAGFGAQMRVRVVLKGRDIWNGSSNPQVYLDGQVFGQSGLRADGTTPCTQLILPSGADARASDFESWFWLSLFVWGQTDYSVADLPLCLTTGDFNGDGVPDIAVATVSGWVFILLNDGNGGFTINARYPVGEWPLSIVAADFNGDGFTDLAVTSYTNGTVTILLGSAGGTFTPSSPISVGNGPWALVAANFNGDAAIDLAVTLAKDNTVSILINGGNGTFSPSAGSPISVAAGAIPIGLVAVDFNGDSFVDLAVLNAGSNNVSLFAGDGQGNFAQNATLTSTLGLPTGSTSTGGVNPYLALPLSIATADFNNDGNADLAVGTIYQEDAVTYSSVAVFLNNFENQGVGDFNADPDYENSVSGVPASLVAANLDPTNPDGGIDLVATGASFLGGTSTFSVLVGNGDGTFDPAVVYPVNGKVDPIAVVAADFNGDGIPDLAMCTEGGNVSVLLNEQNQITSNIVITQVLPAGAVHPGDQIQLIGRGFGVPDLNSVTIAGVAVTVINASLSSDTVLTFTVPSIQGIPTQGETSTLYISNPNGSATWRLFLMQSQASLPTGQLAVAESQVSPKTAVAAGNILVTFTVSGNTTLPDNYTVAANVDAGWTAVLVDGNNKPIVPSQINIPAANFPQMVNTSFVIMVTVPAGLAVGATGNLNASITSQSNPQKLSASTSQPYVLTVGSIPGGSQNAVIISLSSIQAPGSSPDGKTLIIPVNATPPVLVILNLQVNQADSYTVAASGGITFGNPAGWTATVQSGGTFSGPPNPPPMYLQLVAAQGASTTGMTIRAVGANTGAIGQAIFTVQT